MKRVLLSLFVLLSINLSAATLTATQSGNWSDAATWGGTAPTGSADVVTIGAGFTVTLTGATAASSLVLNGTLNDAGFVLTLSKCTYIYIWLLLCYNLFKYDLLIFIIFLGFV